MTEHEEERRSAPGHGSRRWTDEPTGADRARLWVVVLALALLWVGCVIAAERAAHECSWWLR